MPPAAPPRQPAPPSGPNPAGNAVARTAALAAAPRSAMLRGVLDACRDSFLWAAFFSLFINLLMLMPALYMLQVYDRVLASSSESTLLLLTMIAVFLFVVAGGLEWVRGQILIATSARIDSALGGTLFDAMFLRNLRSPSRDTSVQPLSDLTTLRQFLTGPGLLAFFDAPWFPIYLAVLFAFHWMLGAAALFAAIAVLGLTIWNDYVTQQDLKDANGLAVESANHTQRNLRNAEAIAAMGMQPRIRQRWQLRQNEQLALQSRASSRGGALSSTSKTFRQGMQSLILGLGAYLAIRGEVTPGAIIAGSILMGRALAPLDLLVGSWRGFIAARESYDRIDALLVETPQFDPPMPLPAPSGRIAIEKLVIVPPGGTLPILKQIDLDVPSGTALAVIGPSGAGKSTLARAILGIMTASSGNVRFDGADLAQWDPAALGEHIGYLPQDVELLDGTIGENIARFGEPDAQRIVRAARLAGVHEMILRLANGYDTVVGGNVLSAGQRQRVGLARALYGDPRIVLLDEPNSNLDQEGDAALARALEHLKSNGHTVIVITHRSAILSQVDRIALLVDGAIALHDTRDRVLASLQQAGRDAAAQITR